MYIYIYMEYTCNKYKWHMCPGSYNLKLEMSVGERGHGGRWGRRWGEEMRMEVGMEVEKEVGRKWGRK